MLYFSVPSLAQVLLPQSLAFLSMGLSPITHHSANEAIDFKRALKQSQQSIWHGMLPDAKTIRALCNRIPVNYVPVLQP